MVEVLEGEGVRRCGCGMRRGEAVQVARGALWDPYPGSPYPGYPDTDDGSYDDYVVGAIGCSGWGKNVQKMEKKRFESNRCCGRALSLCHHCFPQPVHVCASGGHHMRSGQSQVGS